MYRKLRFTLRYLLGNLAGFEPRRDAVPYAELPATDRFMLSRFAQLMDEVTAAYESYQFARIYQVRRCLAEILLGSRHYGFESS